MNDYSKLTEQEAVAMFPRNIKFRNCEIPLSGHIIGHVVGLALWKGGRFDHAVEAVGHITRLKVNPDLTIGVFVLYAGAREEEPCHPGNLIYF